MLMTRHLEHCVLLKHFEVKVLAKLGVTTAKQLVGKLLDRAEGGGNFFVYSLVTDALLRLKVIEVRLVPLSLQYRAAVLPIAQSNVPLPRAGSRLKKLLVVLL